MSDTVAEHVLRSCPGTPAGWQAGTLAERLTKCFPLAAGWVVDHPEELLTLVHGSIELPPKLPRLPHAWVEERDLTYDPVLDRVFRTKDYRRWAKAKRHATYTLDQTWAMLDAWDDLCGPWHEAPYGRLWYAAEKR